MFNRSVICLLLFIAPITGRSLDLKLGVGAGFGDVSTVVPSMSLRYEIPLIPLIRISPLVRYNLFYRDAALDFSGTGWEVARSEVHSINLGFQLGWAIIPFFEIGMNLDLIGFGFGPDQSLSDSTDSRVGSVPGLNAFLFGSNDEGFLNSQFYLATDIVPKVRLIAAFSHQVVEYEPTQAIAGSPKLNRFVDLLFVGAEFGI